MTAAHAMNDGRPDAPASVLTGFAPATRRSVRRRLAQARAIVESTGDTAALDHVVQSILMTLAMESIPGYAAAVSLPACSTTTMSVADVVARLEAHDRDQAT